MPDSEPTVADALVDRVKQHYDAKEATAKKTEASAQNGGKRVVGRPLVKGTSGNPGGRPKDIIDYVKSNTEDYTELLNPFLSVARGEEVDGHKPTLGER